MVRTDINTINAIKTRLGEMIDISGKSPEQIRKEESERPIMGELPPGTSIEQVCVSGLPGEWVRSKDISIDEKKAILYFHGGAFTSGSCETHRDLAARISKESGIAVLTFEYRLAPENKYLAANDDCLSAYSWLLESGYTPEDIVFGGESVGGTLALMTLLSLRDAGDPLPAGAFLLSPHTDFVYFDSETYRTHADLDPTGSLDGSKRCAAWYLDLTQPRPMLMSPLNQSLGGLPQLFMQVGGDEVLSGEVSEFADRAKAAGVDVELESWENMWHVFQLLAYFLPEAQEAIRNIGSFVQRCLQNR